MLDREAIEQTAASERALRDAKSDQFHPAVLQACESWLAVHERVERRRKQEPNFWWQDRD